jgi:hypothetical protein
LKNLCFIYGGVHEYLRASTDEEGRKALAAAEVRAQQCENSDEAVHYLRRMGVTLQIQVVLTISNYGQMSRFGLDKFSIDHYPIGSNV